MPVWRLPWGPDPERLQAHAPPRGRGEGATAPDGYPSPARSLWLGSERPTAL